MIFEVEKAPIFSGIVEYEEAVNEKVIYDNKSQLKGKSKGALCIFTDTQPTRKFDNEIYIKIYDNFKQSSAKNLIRLSMKDGHIIEHTNSGKDAGKGRLKFTKDVANFVTFSMSQTPTDKDVVKNGSLTVYDAIYDEADGVYNTPCTRYPVPDFMKWVEK